MLLLIKRHLCFTKTIILHGEPRVKDSLAPVVLKCGAVGIQSNAIVKCAPVKTWPISPFNRHRKKTTAGIRKLLCFLTACEINCPTTHVVLFWTRGIRRNGCYLLTISVQNHFREARLHTFSDLGITASFWHWATWGQVEDQCTLSSWSCFHKWKEQYILQHTATKESCEPQLSAQR